MRRSVATLFFVDDHSFVSDAYVSPFINISPESECHTGQQHRMSLLYLTFTFF